jgi:hypothetical protein
MRYNEPSSAQGMTYIIQSTKMPSEFIEREIEKCLVIIFDQNQMIFDFWVSELFDKEVQKVLVNWNEENLKEMYKDIETNS